MTKSMLKVAEWAREETLVVRVASGGRYVWLPPEETRRDTIGVESVEGFEARRYPPGTQLRITSQVVGRIELED